MKLTVVGTGFNGTPAVICLQTTEKLYLFNCGDGTEKVMNESPLTNSVKLHHVFITQLSWENVAGIYAKSLMKKMSAGHENKITIHGAREMEELLDFGVMFLEDNTSQSNFEYHGIEDGTFEDLDLSVEYVPLLSTKAVDQVTDVADKKNGYAVRKCHMQKNADQTFGFICVSKRSEPGIFIGEVTQDSSAELCGLKPGDKIVEVNGNNVEQCSHSDVISLIKERDQEVCLLIADEGCAKYCVENKKPISSAMQETDMLSIESSYDRINAEQMPGTSPTKGRPAMAYIVKFKKDDPKFRAELLTELGIKPGPFIKDIIKGKTVEKDGKVLRPEMFLEAKEIIRPLVVVECPSEDYLDSLLASEQFSSLLDNEETVPQLVVHMSSCCVMDDPRYQEFMQRFKSEKTDHLILKGKVTRLADQGSMMHFLSLNQIHGEIFPQLHYDQSVEVENGNILHGVMNLQYTIKPRNKQGFSWKYVPDLNKEKLLKEFWEGIVYKGETMKALEYVREACKKMEDTSQEKRANAFSLITEYPVLTFLGTGSSIPSKYRSLSCILIETRKDEYIMLDCAEGSVRQLYFMFGEEKAEHILRNLRAIFISHLHYDHHSGILSVVRKKKELLSKQNKCERLLLISPVKLRNYFEIIRKHLFDYEQFFRFVPILSKKTFKDTNIEPEYTRLIHHLLNVKTFTTVPVEHIYGSFGVHFEHQDGWSLMYSGDTAPCKSLINHGYDKTDYLIHEATFSSSDNQRAYVTRHSTAHQAREIGRKMKAKHIILTHFSQRYAKNPVFNDMGDVAFAYDFMQLKPKHIPLVKHLKPALALLTKGDICPENIVYADEQARRFSEIPSYQTLNTCKRNKSDTLEEAPSSKEIRLEDK